MLDIVIPEVEAYDEEKEEFVVLLKEQTLRLEHSLVSLSKWESLWKKPFLTPGEKTTEETLDYIRHMTITQNVSPDVYRLMPPEIVAAISQYIDDPMTATTFTKTANKINREVITAEVIYYWMIALSIPFECQKWHLSRLLTLINVCNIKNQPQRKMTAKEQRAQNKALNASRRAKLNSSG